MLPIYSKVSLEHARDSALTEFACCRNNLQSVQEFEEKVLDTASLLQDSRVYIGSQVFTFLLFSRRAASLQEVCILRTICGVCNFFFFFFSLFLFYLFIIFILVIIHCQNFVVVDQLRKLP